MRVSLLGGMGNQMFQYATALSRARDLQCDLELDVADFSAPENIRVYSLGLWQGVKEPVVSGPTDKIVYERSARYDSDTLRPVDKDTTIRGYWQSEEYFKYNKSQLRRIFYPKQPMTRHHDEIACEILNAGHGSVFVTVRRTDYIDNGIHFNLGMDYYLEAAKTIASFYDPVFFVFSDDPYWCAENFKLPYKTVIAGNYDRTVIGHLGREDEDIQLMTMCRHAIMANSSYSFWGAWLGADMKGGIVIAPKNWYTKESGLTESIAPERWRRL